MRRIFARARSATRRVPRWTILAALLASACAPAVPPPVASRAPDPIVVGFLAPLTGSLASVGKDNQDGFALYLESVGNAAAGRPVAPVYADTQGRPEVGVAKAKQLVERDGAVVLAGITATPVCYAVAAYAKEAGVPLLASGGCAAQRLTADPASAGPLLARVSVSSSVLGDPAGDWAYRAGHRRAILVVSDYGGGLEVADAFASTFVKRGGAIVQELYPALGTADFAPFVAQLDRSADVIVSYVAGLDGLRFAEQYLATAGTRRLPLIDGIGGMTSGPNLTQLGARARGLVGVNLFTDSLDTREARAFVDAFRAKYPGRPISGNVALGYTAAHVFVDAIVRAGGEWDGQRFMAAIAATALETARGRLRFDEARDVAQDMYVFRITDENGHPVQERLATYPDVSRTWDRSVEEVARFPFGQMRGRWVGLTVDALERTWRR